VTALWITNSSGEVLLARRHRSKVTHPLLWGPTVAGNVDEGETYKMNIVKEAGEELGPKNIHPELGPHVKVVDSYHYFVQWYTLQADIELRDMTIQVDEVEEIRWFAVSEMKKCIHDQPEEFLPAMNTCIGLFCPAT